ncbi:hypothetical protein BB559_004645, partial [Furculomyces boomerangus]
MTKFSVKASVHSIAIALSLFQSVNGQFMTKPCPRFGVDIPECEHFWRGKSLGRDTSLPIGKTSNSLQEKNKFCKGDLKKEDRIITDSWVAGQEVTIQFNKTNVHEEGGYCQFSLSYDYNHFSDKNEGNAQDSANIVIVHEKLGDCFANSDEPLTSSIKFTLPPNLPSSKDVVFFWTYINAEEDRNLYMNCADIEIVGKPDGNFSGSKMVVENHLNKNPAVPEFSTSDAPDLDVYRKSREDMKMVFDNDDQLKREIKLRHGHHKVKKHEGEEQMINRFAYEDDILEDLEGEDEDKYDEFYYNCDGE